MPGRRIKVNCQFCLDSAFLPVFFRPKGGKEVSLKRSKKEKPPKRLNPRLGRNYKSPYSADIGDHFKECANPLCSCKGSSIGQSGAPLISTTYRPKVRERNWKDAPKTKPVTPREFSCPECGLLSRIDAREQNHIPGCMFAVMTSPLRKFRQPMPPTYHIQKMHIKMVKGAHLPEPKVETSAFWERYKNDGGRTPEKSEDEKKRKSPPFGR